MKSKETFKQELTEKQKKDIREAFDLFDVDGSGKHNSHNSHSHYRHNRHQGTQGGPPRSRVRAQEGRDQEAHLGPEHGAEGQGEHQHDRLQRVPADHDGQDGNTCECSSAGQQNEKESEEEILRAFQLFDQEKTGFITFENLKKIASELGEIMTDDELKLMILEANKQNKYVRALGDLFFCTAERAWSRKNSSRQSSRERPISEHTYNLCTIFETNKFLW